MSSPLGVSCSACFSSLRIDNAVCLDACGHTFHDACIKRWFRPGNTVCPVCRKSCRQRNIIKLYFRPSDDAQDGNTSDITDSNAVNATTENSASHAQGEQSRSALAELMAQVAELRESNERHTNLLNDLNAENRTNTENLMRRIEQLAGVASNPPLISDHVPPPSGLEHRAFDINDSSPSASIQGPRIHGRVRHFFHPLPENDRLRSEGHEQDPSEIDASNFVEMRSAGRNSLRSLVESDSDDHSDEEPADRTAYVPDPDDVVFFESLESLPVRRVWVPTDDILGDPDPMPVRSTSWNDDFDIRDFGNDDSM